MARSTALQLAAYLRSYRELAEGIADIGFIAAGTVPRRYTRCDKPKSRSHQLESRYPHSVT
jgi:hypothetical protein